MKTTTAITRSATIAFLALICYLPLAAQTIRTEKFAALEGFEGTENWLQTWNDFAGAGYRATWMLNESEDAQVYFNVKENQILLVSSINIEDDETLEDIALTSFDEAGSEMKYAVKINEASPQYISVSDCGTIDNKPAHLDVIVARNTSGEAFKITLLSAKGTSTADSPVLMKYAMEMLASEDRSIVQN